MDTTERTDLANLTLEGPVATLTMLRTDKRNALSPDLLSSLHTRLDELGGAPEINALVLTGAGAAFCAGMDLRAVLSDPDAPLRLLSSIAELTIRVRSLPAVTIARVNGAAIGGGCGLTTACDIVVSHSNAKLGFPEVDLGVCPAVVTPWVHAKVGPGRARRILLEGGTMSGRRAHDLGLVDHLVEAESDLGEAVSDLTSRLSRAGRAALARTKALLNELDGAELAESVRHGAQISADVIAGAEAQGKLSKLFG